MGAAASINPNDDDDDDDDDEGSDDDPSLLLSAEALVKKVAELGPEYKIYKNGFIYANIDGKSILIMSKDQQRQLLIDIGVQNDVHCNAILSLFQKVNKQLQGLNENETLEYGDDNNNKSTSISRRSIERRVSFRDDEKLTAVETFSSEEASIHISTHNHEPSRNDPSNSNRSADTSNRQSLKGIIRSRSNSDSSITIKSDGSHSNNSIKSNDTGSGDHNDKNKSVSIMQANNSIKENYENNANKSDSSNNSNHNYQSDSDAIVNNANTKSSSDNSDNDANNTSLFSVPLDESLFNETSTMTSHQQRELCSN